MTTEKRIWTTEDIEILKLRYKMDGPNVLSKVFNRTVVSVQRKAFYVGLTKRYPGETTIVQKDQLRQVHEKRRILDKDRMGDAEYAEKRKKAIRTNAKKYRLARQARGICERCTKPRIPNNANYCLFHWAATIAGSSKRYDSAFVQKLLDKLEEQDYKCALTGDTLIPSVNASIDHIVPRSKGGSLDDLDNLQWTTHFANKSKWEMTMDEYFDLCQKVIDRKSIVLR